ncbi:MAG: hypothetical protein IT233_01035 [Bacteroidia bacterium]|nr:hypothetical protein [Bacteroidia bacterium]
MKKALAILSISALVLVSCGKGNCDAYGKNKNYKRVGAHQDAPSSQHKA